MEKEIEVVIDAIKLLGIVHIPENAQGFVLFAHGSGSSRLSPRNAYVAKVLQKAHLGTLLIDLLSVEEDVEYRARFDIPLLTSRLKLIIEWLQQQPETSKLPIALFGASTGAAAALIAASDLKDTIKAVVSRGGRPDLALNSLNNVVSPTLLIVGENDGDVITLNDIAYRKLTCIKELIIIPGATHLFEEPGCLEQVAECAKKWFCYYMTNS